MAATLAEMFHIAIKRDFRHIDLRTARILLYEAGPRVLPTYRENLSLQARRHLEGLGVELHVNTSVTKVDASGIVAGGQKVSAATVVWGAGVVASHAAKWLGLAGDASGKIAVGPDLSVPGYPEIFAIGDTAHVVALSRNLIGIRSREPMVLPGVPQPGNESSGASAILVLGQGRSCCCRSNLRSSGSALRKLLGIPGVVHLGGGPHLFSDRVCQSRICAAAVGIRFCYEAAARAGS